MRDGQICPLWVMTPSAHLHCLYCLYILLYKQKILEIAGNFKLKAFWLAVVMILWSLEEVEKLVEGWGLPRGHTCDVDGNDVCGHSLGCLSHLLLWRGEGCSLVPHLIINLSPLACITLWGLGPHGELRFIILHRRTYGLEAKGE